MALFDNVNLMELLLSGSQVQSNKNLADKAGLDMADFGRIAAVGLPAILSAINKNNQSDRGLESFDQALNKHEDVKQYDSLDQLTQNVDPQDGDKILGHVFADKQTNIIDRIADTLGLTPEAVKRALIVIAPLVLKYLADRKDTKQLDRDGIQKETKNSVEEINSSLRNYQKKAPSNEGGSILDSIFGQNQAQSSNTQQNSNGGLLDNILDLLK
ncbi:DUF937 domain-containing protein [Facklamia sp. DSM 111018]|uniref:DUF937 domain-containing protein n=1 Tax=Facklamia lactis TaxID=2749967 RepID=A0ABS0LMN8_9LACT|nr:DUF937 domain-containing protein [Facklamia lactis]MBG9979885.1 DUF937 domain-containing protein [Facklamia lactis]MBG9985435.1 DUF937 domain-containing protein [Facklamia lactis]